MNKLLLVDKFVTLKFKTNDSILITIEYDNEDVRIDIKEFLGSSWSPMREGPMKEMIESQIKETEVYKAQTSSSHIFLNNIDKL